MNCINNDYNSRVECYCFTFLTAVGLTSVVIGTLSILGAKGIVNVGSLSRIDEAIQWFLVSDGIVNLAIVAYFASKKKTPAAKTLPKAQEAPKNPILHPPLSQTHPL